MPLLSRISRFIAIGATLVVYASSCVQAPETGEVEVVFTASGVVLANTGNTAVGKVLIRNDGEEIDADAKVRMNSLCLVFDWDPGEEYEFIVGDAEVSATAPLQPALALLGTISFDENILSLKASSTDRSASSLAISPSAQLSAIGTDDGEVILFSLVEGRIIDRHTRPGSYIRSLVFLDEEHLAVGEQAPAGSIILYKITSGRLSEKWRFDAGDIIGRGTYDESDPFSWAHQPGIYRLSAGPEGDLYAIAMYSPFVDGERQARWAAARLSGSTGEQKWIYRSNESLAGVATWFDIDGKERRIAICVGMDSGAGALVLLDAETGEPLAQYIVEPMLPHLQTVSFWKGISLSPDGGTIYAITNDGRALVWDGESETAITLELGEPILAGDYPVLISGVGALASKSGAYFITGTTYIPWELNDGEAVPQPHPSANTVFYVREDGALAWSVPIANLSQGFALSNNGEWLFVSYASNPAYSSETGAGLAVIRSGEENGEMVATFPVAGTVADGSPVIDASNRFVMIAENGRRSSGGETVEGLDRIHLLYW